MPKPKGPKSERERKAKRKEQLSKRLELPVLDPLKLERLQSTKRRNKTVQDLQVELEEFTAVSEAVRRSHRYYIKALHKVYEVWIDLLSVQEEHRDALIHLLNAKNKVKTKRGDALHVLLRSLIDYGSGEQDGLDEEARKKATQAAWSRVSRDAAVLRNAERISLPADDFVEHVLATRGGLNQMADDEARARRLERSFNGGGSPVERREERSSAKTRQSGDQIAIRAASQKRSLKERDSEVAPIEPAESADDDPANSKKWRFGKSLKRCLLSPTLSNREVILRVFLGADGLRVVRDAYQMSTAHIDDDAFAKHMEGLGARLVAVGSKRPRV